MGDEINAPHIRGRQLLIIVRLKTQHNDSWLGVNLNVELIQRGTRLRSSEQWLQMDTICTEFGRVSDRAVERAQPDSNNSIGTCSCVIVMVASAVKPYWPRLPATVQTRRSQGHFSAFLLSGLIWPRAAPGWKQGASHANSNAMGLGC